eukprot:Awhi_evm1s8764
MPTCCHGACSQKTAKGKVFVTVPRDATDDYRRRKQWLVKFRKNGEYTDADLKKDLRLCKVHLRDPEAPVLFRRLKDYSTVEYEVRNGVIIPTNSPPKPQPKTGSKKSTSTTAKALETSTKTTTTTRVPKAKSTTRATATTTTIATTMAASNTKNPTQHHLAKGINKKSTKRKRHAFDQNNQLPTFDETKTMIHDINQVIQQDKESLQSQILEKAAKIQECEATLERMKTHHHQE